MIMKVLMLVVINALGHPKRTNNSITVSGDDVQEGYFFSFSSDEINKASAEPRLNVLSSWID